MTGEFIPDWAGTLLNDLHDKILTTMPLNAPGVLRPTIAADILAFISKENNFPAGPKELEADMGSLDAISFDVMKAKLNRGTWPRSAARPRTGSIMSRAYPVEEATRRPAARS